MVPKWPMRGCFERHPTIVDCGLEIFGGVFTRGFDRITRLCAARAPGRAFFKFALETFAFTKQKR